MSQGKHVAAVCSEFIHRNFLWLLIGSYGAAAVWPAAGLWIRGVSFGEVALFGERTAATLPMLMLALLLVNAGLGVRTSELKHLLNGSLVLLVGLGANLVVPIAYTFGVTQALRFWHNASEVQYILLGLALVATMPIAGSSTAWSQIANGNLTLSLGLVLFSTLLSPVSTPAALHSVGLMARGDSAEELHKLAADDTGGFLVLCVVFPSFLGIFGRWVIGEARIESAKHPLKLFTALNLLLLNYSNASLSLPGVLAQPDVDFLILTMGIVVGLCIAAFASGWLIARLMRVDRAQQTALMFGLGMNNNGTALVLASLALADYPRVMLPIILYNLGQHLVAGSVVYLFSRTAADSERTPPGEGLLVAGLVGAGFLVVALLLARWSRGDPVVKFRPGDQNVAAGQTTEWTFDTDPVGASPTGGEAFGGEWVVRPGSDAPSPPNFLCQTAAAPFPALCLGGQVYTDLEVSVRFKPLSGQEDRAAGIIFRVQDRDNYYIFRANALENNVMFFIYASGQRTILKRGTARVPSGQWQELKVEVVGNHFRGFLDGKLVAEVSDDSYKAGKVGLWTKADSVTCFDSVRVIAR